MKSQKELNLDERILESLKPEKWNGECLPYETAKMLMEDKEVTALQDYANTVAIVRLGFNDHGPVHMRTVTKNAIKMMRLLHSSGIQTSLETEKIGSIADSLTAVIFAAFLHDLGMTIGRQDHELYSVHLALPIIDRMLLQLLPDTPEKSNLEKRVIIRSLAMEGIAGHMGTHRIHSIEAGLILVADGCDMTKGRARIPIAISNEAKVGDIHKYSANSIESVHITHEILENASSTDNQKAENLSFNNQQNGKPILIEVSMSSEVGFFQIEEVLIPKLNSSPVRPYISLSAGVEGSEYKKYL